MKTNITIKDVAKEAGVSVATVSYVLNNRTDKRISDKTRKKVLQVANLLNYTPNQSAKALVTSRCNMIALYVSQNPSALKSTEQMYFLNFLSTFLHSKNYDLIYLSDSYTEKFDRADAIVCLDVSKDFFYQVGDCNFIPLLAMDCIINDPLFFQVNSDYDSIKMKARKFFKNQAFTFVSLDIENQNRKNHINKIFENVIFVSDISDLNQIPASENLVITDRIVYNLLNHTHPVYYTPYISNDKAEALFQCIEYAISKLPIEQHDILV